MTSLPTPFYEERGIRLYHANAFELLPLLRDACERAVARLRQQVLPVG